MNTHCQHGACLPYWRAIGVVGAFVPDSLPGGDCRVTTHASVAQSPGAHKRATVSHRRSTCQLHLSGLSRLQERAGACPGMTG